MPSWTHLTRLPAEIAQRACPRRPLTLARGRRLLVGNRVARRRRSSHSRTRSRTNSQLGRTLRPPAQLFMTRWLGAGNERAMSDATAGCSTGPTSNSSPTDRFLDPAYTRAPGDGGRSMDRPAAAGSAAGDPGVEAAARRARDRVDRGADAGQAGHPSRASRGTLRRPTAAGPEPVEPRSLDDDLARAGVQVFDAESVLAAGGAGHRRRRSTSRPTRIGGPRPWKRWLSGWSIGCDRTSPFRL